jgi:tRNA pseudouridine55 synthase
MLGILNLNKPAGMTSRHAVNRATRIFHPAKAGHAGTLDPLASGVLVVCIGAATRLIEYVQQAPKRYRAEFLLGHTSPSEDLESETTPLDDPPQPTDEEIRGAAASFVGTIQQRPPAYSAIKVGGRRAYRLARAGQQVELPSRPVTIHRLDTIAYDYPKLTLDVECSAGTYVRSLGRDLARSLQSDAVMSALVRTAVGAFTLDDAVAVEDWRSEVLLGRLLPARDAVVSLPPLLASPEEEIEISHGRPIACPATSDASEFAAYDSAGRLLAILERRGENQLRPKCNFIAAGARRE